MRWRRMEDEGGPSVLGAGAQEKGFWYAVGRDQA